jgi:membrane-anchored protein YejM (alkaline phosphatase superfamily)
MKAATIHELKQELLQAPASTLTELCLRLARFKKENKELLTYLLFEANDTAAYIESAKKEITSQFADINKSNVYFVKKTLRKILRMTNKFTRYSGLATVEIELLIFFCRKMKELGISISGSPVLSNIYLNQLKKINKTLATLHEDLQYDYLQEIKEL